MVTIRKKLCPRGRYYLKCPYERRASRIVVHNTANDAPAINEITYMINNDSEVSYHYAVDDREAVQGLPLDRNAWASGDGHGVGNMEGIHIEICWSLSGGERFLKAEKNTVHIIAYLLKQYGWGIDRVTKHQDYDGKYCPHRTLDLGWQRFLNMVKKEMEEAEDMTEEKVKELIREELGRRARAAESKETPGWAKEAMDYVRRGGILKGDKNGRMRPEAYLKRDEFAQAQYNRDHRYQTLEDIPKWASEAVGELIDRGVILGAGEKDRVALNMSQNQLRSLVWMKRYVDQKTAAEGEQRDSEGGEANLI